MLWYKESYRFFRIIQGLCNYDLNECRYQISRSISFSPTIRLRSSRNKIETEILPEKKKKTLINTYIEPITPPAISELKKTLEENENRFNKLAATQNSRKRREKSNLIFLEGTDLINSALDSEMKLESIFYSKDYLLKTVNIGSTQLTEKYKVTDKTLRTLCGIRPSPGIIAVCEKPMIETKKSFLPVTVLCSNIKDSENLGLVIATAAAAGCQSVLLIKGCADPWDRKALSSAEGGHFHISVVNNINWEEITNHISINSAFYIADGSSDVDIDDSQIYSDVDYDMGGKSEMRIDYLQPPVSSQQSHELQKYETPSILTHLYSSIAFPPKDIVVCLGGETTGIDPIVEQLGKVRNAQKLKIPLENGVDSLNVCSALSILLFEIKRQFSKKS